ncbi:hypothetical protein PCANC_16071 [Puccinia coronata f. sp. avenae]|uniref:RING-type domain-containing protein n=1 Tax=Puccinia coronata f. sp. avenae TaxID=200324 RepID=A0A2N5UA42_9BASI|nr:hypothetical protein PCANC_16071 [Puccinia coronata f. sp. avenae]
MPESLQFLISSSLHRVCNTTQLDQALRSQSSQDQSKLPPSPHQSLLKSIVPSGSFRKPSSLIGYSFRSATRSPNPEAPTATLPSLGECPICLKSMVAKSSFQRVFEKFRSVRRWPKCGHGCHRKCYRKSRDRDSPCAVCEAVDPSFTAERHKDLENLRREPPETHGDEIATQLQTDALPTQADLAEDIQGSITTLRDPDRHLGTSYVGCASSGTGRYHNSDEEHSSRAVVSLPLQHKAHQESNHVGKPVSSSGGYNNDEELPPKAVPISLQNDVHHHSDHMGIKGFQQLRGCISLRQD